MSWLQSPSAVILEPKKIKAATTSTFPPSVCHELMGKSSSGGKGGGSGDRREGSELLVSLPPLVPLCRVIAQVPAGSSLMCRSASGANQVQGLLPDSTQAFMPSLSLWCLGLPAPGPQSFPLSWQERDLGAWIQHSWKFNSSPP